MPVTGAGILCPACGSDNNAVKHTRPNAGGIWRRRWCLECRARWSTHETNMQKVKRNRTIDDAVAAIIAAGKVPA